MKSPVVYWKALNPLYKSALYGFALGVFAFWLVLLCLPAGK